MGSFDPKEKSKPGFQRSLIGFGAVARPSSFGRPGRIVRPQGSAYKRPEQKSVQLGRMTGSTTQGSAIKHEQKLLGPRISHIGTGPISNTYMLSGLSTGQTSQAQLFNPKDLKSQARQTGRPLGYGTVYKFV